MSGQSLVYVPAGPVVARFHQSRAFGRGIIGPVGSGKTTALVADALYIARTQAPGPDGIRRTRIVFLRNTEPQLKTTTIRTFQEMVPAGYCKWTFDSPITCRLQTEDLDCEVLFLALDNEADSRKLLSLEATVIVLNEARELPRAVLDLATTRVGRYPSARMGGCTRAGIILDTNPPDDEHWLYDLAEVSKPPGWEFFKQPSGLSAGAENLHNLNQSPATLRLAVDDPVRRAKGREYYERIAAGKSEDWTRVYVHGQYGLSFDGKAVFPEYSDSLHTAPEPLDPLPESTVHVGIDFGLTPAAVFLQRDERGRWLVVHELVAEDMGMESFGRLLSLDLAEHFPGCDVRVWCDPAGMQRSQVDERTPIDLLKRMHLPARPAPSNDLLLRLEAVRRPLSRLIDGRPGFVVCPELKKLRKALAGGYQYRRHRISGGERYHDLPDKNEHSHVADALQYALLGAGENPRRRDQPRLATQAIGGIAWTEFPELYR